MESMIGGNMRMADEFILDVMCCPLRMYGNNPNTYLHTTRSS